MSACIIIASLVRAWLYLGLLEGRVGRQTPEPCQHADGLGARQKMMVQTESGDVFFVVLTAADCVPAVGHERTFVNLRHDSFVCLTR